MAAQGAAATIPDVAAASYAAESAMREMGYGTSGY